MMGENDQPCQAIDCEREWSWECPHGRWCLPHTSAHMKADADCYEDIDAAMVVWLARFAAPLVESMGSFDREVSALLYRAEREMFPAKFVGVDMLRRVVTLHESLVAKIKEELEAQLAQLRDNFEGTELPAGASDEEVWRWVEARSRALQDKQGNN